MPGIDFEPIDRHLAGFLDRMAGGAPGVYLATLLVSRATREGHICLDLRAAAGQPVPDVGVCPAWEEWETVLLNSGVAGQPGEGRPLVLDTAGRLYLARYHAYESDLAGRLRALFDRVQAIDMAKAQAGLARLFPGLSEKKIAPQSPNPLTPLRGAKGANSGGDRRLFAPIPAALGPLSPDGERGVGDRGDLLFDWQAVAACAALARGLTIFVGGPGTGKTTTVARILALIIEQAPQALIALAAPTGKAAYRLQAAVAEAAQRLDISGDVRDRMPGEASTIHRLLGARPNSPFFRHDGRNPLPHDTVVVDEASMVDLALMAKLVCALKPTARLILLGDKDQLASVQAGHVLGDICRPAAGPYSSAFAAQVWDLSGMSLDGRGPARLRDAVVELTRTYRFAAGSGIAALAQAVNRGADCAAVLTGNHADLVHHVLPAPALLKVELADVIGPFYRRVPSDIPGRLTALRRLCILCALKEGPYGVARLNELVEAILAEARLIRPEQQFYHGRPIMITANDYGVRLFNGDMGLILKDPADGRLYAWFETPDGPARRVSPARLPAHETAYAMTVHKSQGSEFAHVLLVLPDRDTPVLTRELVYTGITRARERLDLWADPAILRTAASRRIERASGLRDALWGG